MTLSVCLLTRNEAKNIVRAIQSVVGLADEVLVADTGSTDNTVALAQEQGARVLAFAWDDDFAAGRNFALNQAKSDWVLWLNPDEELLPDSHALVREVIRKSDALGYLVLRQELMNPSQLDVFSESEALRLFRRLPELRYTGRSHPAFDESIEQAARREGKFIHRSAITLRHHAYLSPQTPDKLRWRARLLRRELEDRPGQLRFLIEYGRTLLQLQDPKGHEVLAEAAEKVLAMRDEPLEPVWNVEELLEYLMDVSPGDSRSPLTAADARMLALRWYPTSPPLLWKMAEYLFGQNDFQTSASLLERLLHLGKTRSYSKCRGFDPQIVGERALFNLGHCRMRLGQWADAQECFRQLLASSIYEVQAAKNLMVIQRQLGQQQGQGWFQTQAAPGPH
jgi:tetratricopeptide (TPR) repeat protein